jgi:hypothetical protein
VSKESGWTVDTLREHFTDKLSDTREGLQQQLIELRALMHMQYEDHRRMLDERYTTQTKALDAAFKAAEQAVVVALSNAEKATAKAEVAAERRFESVNEFRKTLSDQTATFIPRAEFVSAQNSLSERIAINAERVSALELRLTSRLDLGEGGEQGLSKERVDKRAEVTQIIQIITIVLLVAGLLVTILLHV